MPALKIHITYHNKKYCVKSQDKYNNNSLLAQSSLGIFI